ncbi:MAG: thioesterase family protein, partial [Bacteroidota bacterium]
DELRHVNNVRYVQWVQDVAKEHWKSLVSMEMQQQVVWVLLRHHIHYKNAAILDDAITIKTHVAHSRGAKSTRIVEMFNTHTQKPLIHSETEWCLLDAVTKRPIRIPEEIMWAFSK